jgi:CMP-N-acetylneuraminic acid synthetase
MRVVAVVPVKATSDRVQAKNFREFYEGKSLFDLLLDKLLASSEIDQVYVSSNAIDLKDRVESSGARFVQREDALCNNEVPWSDVIAHVAESIPEENDVPLLWCHTTSPLFGDYDNAVRKYMQESGEGEYDGLVAVAKLSEFVVSEKRQPLNYSWGPWHKYSQYLDKLYAITGGLFIAQKQEMIRNRYVISKNPYFFEVSPLEAIDVDTQYDFELAKILMKNREHLESHT